MSEETHSADPSSLKNFKDLSFACVDGGVWANDPRLIALLFQRVKLENLVEQKLYFVLSFGTGRTNIPPGTKEYKDNVGFSKISWLPVIGNADYDISTC